MIVNIAYDYRITIVIWGYEICTENEIKMDCLLRPNKGIDGHAYCKTRENPNFLKNCKMVISVKIRSFLRSRMMKRTSPLESSRKI